MSRRLNEKEKIILKLEITSLFFLIEKVYADWWKKNNHGGFFGGELNISIQDINADIENLLKDLLDFEIALRVKTTSSVESININIWEDFFNDWRKWRGVNLDSNKEKIIQVILGSCEGLNSGIEKGSPKEQIKGNEPFIANAFGTLKFIPDENFIEELRRIIFNSNGILSDIKNLFGNYNIQIQDKDIPNFNLLHIFEDFKTILSKTEVYSNELDSLRDNLYRAFKLLYKFIPSDSRFPINDTSLFDQIYMSTSMFKAKLNELLSENLEIELEKVKKHQNFKWSILGIQYDKFGLAEKGLKLASIQWYREISEKIDEEIKKLLEVEYPIGNEIYRDETGIYFIVGESIGKLPNEIEEKIKNIFENTKLDDREIEGLKNEVFFNISFSKPSRGLMNLSTLLENAKIKFSERKKIEFVNFEFDTITHNGKEYKVKKGNNFTCITKKDPNTGEEIEENVPNIAIGICPICQVRLIYMEDTKRNNKPTICEVCNERVHHFMASRWIKNLSKETIWIEEVKDKNNRVAYISLKFELKDWLNGNLSSTLLSQIIDFPINPTCQNYENLIHSISQDIRNNKKLDQTCLRDYHTNVPNKPLKNIIESWFLERSIGQKWEEFIYKQLNDWDETRNKPKKQKIDFDRRRIFWRNLDNNDIEFLATLLLQFLLRKNPSPARLRRIWETTREFFEDIHKDLDNILKVPEWRKKRLVWEIDLNENNKLNKSMELEAEELLFWAEKINDSKAKIYLISSIKDFLLKFGKSDIKKQVVESNNDLLNEKMGNLKENIVEKELVLKPYNSTNDEENNIKITTSDFSEIKEYKPFAKITDPSPKNYQIVIPAEYLEKFIDKVMERYDKEFKYVYGKLPLHIGIVVSHYKKPTYVNLKALRKIRRDVENISFLRKKLRWDKFRNVYTLKLKNASRKYREDFIKEIKNRTHIYYSLYWFNLDKKDYNFYVKPDKFGKKWLAFHTKFRKNRDNRITYYPNTFDFEFMDTNTRRNDIFYDENKKYKRVIKRKSNRPYEIEKYWEKFKAFKELVSDKNYQRSRLFKIIETIYPKLPEIENIETDYSYMFAPVFYRYLDLNDRNRRKIFKKIFSIDENLNSQEYLEKLRETLSDTTNLYLFLDMFEFWHTMLKEV